MTVRPEFKLCRSVGTKRDSNEPAFLLMQGAGFFMLRQTRRSGGGIFRDTPGGDSFKDFKRAILNSFLYLRPYNQAIRALPLDSKLPLRAQRKAISQTVEDS